MNAMDMRVLGASALTAAIVSVGIGVVMARRECTPQVVAVPAAAPVVVAPTPTQPPLVAEPVEDEEVELDNCEVLKEMGMERINMGQHAAALVAFEKALECNDDPYVRQLAFMESCASGNSKKAKLFYKKLTPAQQTKFAQICIRQKPPVAYE